MKICIIEDDDYKMSDLKDWASTVFPNATLILATSIRSAPSALSQGPFSFILLDMQLKLYETASAGLSNQKTAPLAGERILKQLQRNKSLEKVIVITQYTTFSEKVDEVNFEGLCSRLHKSCPDVFMGGVQYLYGSSNWRKSLSDLVRGIT